MRSTNGGASFVSLPLIPGANTTYKDTGLTANTTYTYEVVATNASGNSAPSNAATVQTFPPAPPAPSGLTAIATSSVEVTLSWLPTSGTETGFEIERRSPGTVFTVLPLTVVPKGATSAVDPSVVPGTSYTYRIIAFNQSGDSRPSNTASCITPPASPTNLTATPTSSSSVVLSWVNPSPNPQGITVLRGVGVLAPVPIKNLNGKLTTYTDTSAIASTFYTYEVIATDKGGNSAPSNSVNVTMPPPPPGTPVNLNAVTASTVQIDLSWTRTGASETGFSIERRTGSESFAQIATVVAGVTLFNDTTCEANTNYIYRVRGYNSGGYSAYTNTASATTLSNAPNNLVATLTPANSVLLTWINNSLTSTVHIHRTGGAGAVDFYISGTQSSYTDSTVQPGMNYTYVVYANNQGGDSTPSNQVGITTP
jgi:titin